MSTHRLTYFYDTFAPYIYIPQRCMHIIKYLEQLLHRHILITCTVYNKCSLQYARFNRETQTLVFDKIVQRASEIKIWSSADIMGQANRISATPQPFHRQL